MEIKSVPIIATCKPGGSFLVRYTLDNTGDATSGDLGDTPVSVSVFNALSPFVEDYKWWIGGPGVTCTMSTAAELYGHGSVNDVITVPAGVIGTFELEVITNAKRLPAGQSLVVSTDFGGQIFADVCRVLNDNFAGHRLNTDVEKILAVFIGLNDPDKDLQAAEIHDLLNRGLRFRHMVKDLADRRGFPISTDAAGRTLLGDNTPGVGARVYHGIYAQTRHSADFDLTDVTYVTSGVPPDKTTNQPQASPNGWGLAPS